MLLLASLLGFAYSYTLTGVCYVCRQLLISALKAAGLKPYVPEGGFFIVADTSKAQVRYNSSPTPRALSAPYRWY